MPSVLIIDDAVYLRLIIGRILKQHGWTLVGEVETVDAAATLYSQHQPDVVLLDGELAGQEGLAALQWILARDAQARVVVMSAMGQQGSIIAAVEAGAADYIVKPFTAERLMQALERSLHLPSRIAA